MILSDFDTTFCSSKGRKRSGYRNLLFLPFPLLGFYNLDASGARAYCACSRCGWGLFGIFTLVYPLSSSPSLWGVVGWCRVNFQCRGVLLIWIRVGQGPTALAVGAGGGCLDIFSLVYRYSFLSPSLWETAR